MTRYRIVPERSQVWIEGTSSLHPIRTTTTGLDGWLDLDVLGGGKVNVSQPAKGRIELPVESLQSGNRLEDREMRRRIDSRRYPQIIGEMTAIQEGDGEGRYRVSGDLTFRGVTKSFEDEMTVSLDGADSIVMEGEKEFDIRDFGMEPPRILTLRVHPEVTVRVKVVAEKEA